MSRIEPTAPLAASETGHALLEQAVQGLDQVPDPCGRACVGPAVDAAHLALGEAFAATSLTPLERQVVLLTVGRMNAGGPCMATHGGPVQITEIPGHILRAIRDDHAIDEPQLESLRRFTARLVEQHGRIEARDRQAFLAAGYRPEQMREVILGVVTETLSSHLATSAADRQTRDPEASNAGTAESL